MSEECAVWFLSFVALFFFSPSLFLPVARTETKGEIAAAAAGAQYSTRMKEEGKGRKEAKERDHKIAICAKCDADVDAMRWLALSSFFFLVVFCVCNVPFHTVSFISFLFYDQPTRLPFLPTHYQPTNSAPLCSCPFFNPLVFLSRTKSKKSKKPSKKANCSECICVSFLLSTKCPFVWVQWIQSMFWFCSTMRALCERVPFVQKKPSGHSGQHWTHKVNRWVG